MVAGAQGSGDIVAAEEAVPEAVAGRPVLPAILLQVAPQMIRQDVPALPGRIEDVPQTMNVRSRCCGTQRRASMTLDSTE